MFVQTICAGSPNGQRFLRTGQHDDEPCVEECQHPHLRALLARKFMDYAAMCWPSDSIIAEYQPLGYFDKRGVPLVRLVRAVGFIPCGPIATPHGVSGYPSIDAAEAAFVPWSDTLRDSLIIPDFAFPADFMERP